MIRTIFLALCVFLVGCSVNESEIYGTYRYEKRGFVQQLLLKPDGTFEQSLRLKKTMSEDLFVEGTYQFLKEPNGFSSLRFEGYMVAIKPPLDSSGEIFYDNAEKWEKRNPLIPGPIRIFGATTIEFTEYENYKKVKDWKEGDTLKKSTQRANEGK